MEDDEVDVVAEVYPNANEEAEVWEDKGRGEVIEGFGRLHSSRSAYAFD